jgi:deoxyribonuclease-4
MELLFGTAGIPVSAKGGGTAAGIERIRELGLGCMELEFVRGVTMTREVSHEVRRAKERTGVALSVHAPYYINLNAKEEEKREASIRRILDSARIGYAAGARDIVFHPGYYLKRPEEEVYEVMREAISGIMEVLDGEGIDVTLRPETTGKHTQFGSLEELISLSQEVGGVLPCVDFAHIHARTWRNNSKDEFMAILERLEKELGKEAVENLHAHVSGIEYGRKGEKRHLIFQDSDFNYVDLAAALKEFCAAGMVICESPNLEEDALELKGAYEEA